MALKHHWKFNNNLQDAIGDLHLTNVVGTPAYGNNKDGVANSCLDNSVVWYAYSDIYDVFNIDQRSISFWYKNVNDTTLRTYFSDSAFIVDGSNTNIRIRRNNSTTGQLSIIIDTPINNWNNIIFTINRDGIKKLFIDGVLKGIITNTWTYLTTTLKCFAVNATTTSGISGSSVQKDFDEIKYFDHILTDGGVTTIGQVASLDSEVWQLYISGVNNIPAYTLNSATEIAGTSAKLSWNES
jgi:hypothetical protein